MPFSAQFSAIVSSVDTPTTWAGEHVLAPPFFILNSETFPDILFADKQLSWSKWLSIYFLLKKVWYHNKMNETLRTWEANSHLPSCCPPHLRINGQIFQVSNCPQHKWQDQIKFPRISQLEYLRGHQNSHLLRGRASTAQQGQGWLDLNMTFPKWWAPNRVRVPPEVWN